MNFLIFICGFLLLGIEGGVVKRQTFVDVSTPETNVRVENGIIICDTLSCPLESFKCTVVKNTTIADVTKVEVVRQCLDEQGKVITKTNDTLPSQYPSLRFESFASVDRNGNVASYDNRGNSYNYSEADAAEIHSYIYKQIEDLHKSILGQIQNTQDYARNARFHG